MRVRINGEEKTVSDDCSIHELLNQLELTNAACAVEINRELIPKRQHIDHLLADGDQVEIVTLVGGG